MKGISQSLSEQAAKKYSKIKAMKFPNQVLSSMKTNSSRICFTFYCQYWRALYTYTVYENYHDAFLSFFSYVTILIKHRLKKPFRKNYSVTFDSQQIIQMLNTSNFLFKKLILICSFLLLAISILLVEYFMLKRS